MKPNIDRIFTFLILFVLVSFHSLGQSIVTPANDVNSMCIGGASEVLSTISVSETQSDDFANGGGNVTFILIPPSNFEFVPATGSVNLNSGGDMTFVGITTTASQVEITFDITDDLSVDDFEIVGLEIIALSPFTAGDISRPAVGGGDMVVNGAAAAGAGTSYGGVASTQQAVSITGHPIDRTVCEGETRTFSVTASGTNLSYQWQVDDGGGGGFVNLSDDATYDGSSTQILEVSNISSLLDGYQYRVVVTGDCASNETSNIATLTVNELPEVTMQPTNDATCEGGNASFTINTGATTAPDIAWQVSTNGGGSYTDLTLTPPYSNINQPTLNITGAAASLNGNYYRARVNGTCSPAVFSQGALLTVETEPVISVHPVNDDECEGGGVSFTVSATGSNLEYLWYEEGSPLSNGGKYSGATSSTLVVTGVESSMNGNEYYVEVSNGSGQCSGSVNSNIATLTVNELPEVTTQPTNDVICEGGNASFTINTGATTVPDITWQVSTNGGSSYTDLTATPPYSNIDQPTLNITGATSALSGNYYRARVSGTCSPAVFSQGALLTVETEPVISVHPVNDDECEGGGVSFTVSAAGSNLEYLWYEEGSPLSNGGKYSGATSSTLVVTGVESSMNGNEYYVEVSNGSGECGGSVNSNIATLTVNELPEVTTQPANDATCEGGNASFTINTGATTAPDITWQVSTNGGSSYTDLTSTPPYSNINQPTLDITGAAASLNGNYYRARVSGTCSPAVFSQGALLTVETEPVISVHPVNDDECEGGGVSFTVSATGSNLEYLWYEEGSPLSNGGKYSGATSSTLVITGVESSMNANEYYVEVSNGSGQCSGSVNSNIATLTVNEQPEIIDQPDDITVCSGTGATFSVDGGVTTGADYQWQVNTGSGWGNVVNGGIYSGALTDELSISATDPTMNDYLYRVIVSGICTPSVTSSQARLTVQNLPEVTLNPTNETVCEGTNVNFEINTGTTTNPTIRWQVFTGTWNDLNNNGTYSGVSTSTLTVTSNSSLNGLQYRARVSGVCTPQVFSTAATLTVNEQPEIVDQPDDITVCSGTGATFSVDGGVTTGADYQWQVNTGSGWNNVVNGGIYSGALTDELSISATDPTMNDYLYRVIVSGTCTPSVTSSQARLTVQNLPQVTLNPTNETVCEGTNVNFEINVGSTTNPTIRWQVFTGTWNDLNNNGTYSGVSTSTLTVTSNSSLNGLQYRARVSGVCTPQVFSTAATLTVNEQPEIIDQPDDITVCSGTGATFSVDGGVTTGADYQWQINTGSGWNNVVNGGIYSGALTDELSISATDPTMNDYLYRVIVSGTCTPPVTSSQARLTVQNLPEVTLNPTNETVCEGTNVNFEINTGTTTNPTIRWQVLTGTWNDLNNNGTYSGVSTPTLTVTSNSSLNGLQYRARVSGVCTPQVFSTAATLTVNEQPEIIDQPQDSIVCTGTGASFSVNAGSTSGVNYQWQINTGSGWNNVVNSGVYSGAATNELLISSTIPSMNNYLYRVVVSGTCTPSVTSSQARLTVHNLIVDEGSDATFCQGTSLSLGGTPTATGGAGSYTYTWTGFDDATGFSSSVANPFINFNSEGSYRYNVEVVDAFGCNVTSGFITVEVDPGNIVSAGPDTVLCEGPAAIEIQGASIGGGTTDILWTVESGSGTLQDEATLTPQYLPGAAETGTVVLKMTGSDPSSCPDVSDLINVTINMLPTVDQGSDREICETSDVKLNGTVGGTAFMGTWTTSGDGDFSSATDLNATYVPGENDKINGSVYLTLTTNDPSGPCPAVDGSLLLEIRTAAVSVPGTYPELCIGDTVDLSGVIQGSATNATWTGGTGTFINPGQLDAQYVPAQFEAGTTVVLTLTTNNPPGPCPADAQSTAIIVNPLPLVDFSGLAPTYGINDNASQLTGFPDNTGFFSGPGIISNVFTPSQADTGVHDISYTYQDIKGCVNTRVRQTEVFALTPIFIDIPSNLCTNSGIHNVYADPPGGTWAGNGIINVGSQYLFNPAYGEGSGPGSHTLTYTYTDDNDVTVVVEGTVNVFGEILPDFEVHNFCVSDSIVFEDLSYITDNTIPHEIVEWKWDFGDMSLVSGETDPKHLYDEPKTYLVTLNLKSSNPNCVATISKNVIIGGQPEVNFDFQDVAFGDNTRFTENSVFQPGDVSLVDSVRWNFDDGTVVSGLRNEYGSVFHTYLDSGDYNVLLRVVTNRGCIGERSRRVSILPQVEIYPYFQNFDGASGWVVDDDGLNSSWEMGTPSGEVINQAYSGSTAWVTNLAGTHNNSESSWVFSPSFDLRPLSRPMVSIAVWSDTETRYDGAIMQFSLDGGENWTNLGSSDDGLGLNWYNYNTIAGRPGEGIYNPDGHGWSGQDAGWKIARRHLDDLETLWPFGGNPGRSAVRFRIAFGSNGDNAFDGFAFDDFWIGERTNNVLLENFTSIASSTAPASDNSVYGILAQKPLDGVLLQYHLKYPQADEVYLKNPFPPDARGSIYNLTQTPVQMVEGMHRFTHNGTRFNLTHLINNSLKDPKFDIELSYEETENHYEIVLNTELRPLIQMPGEVVVHKVLVEKEVDIIDRPLRHVVKEMYPASGSLLSVEQANQVQSFSNLLDFRTLTFYDSTQLAVVVFVQDPATREVLQSQIIDLPIKYPRGAITSVDTNDPTIAKGLKIYPNPVKDKLNIELPFSLGTEAEWKIVDQSGAIISHGNLNKGHARYTVDTHRLPNGVYFLMVSEAENLNFRHKLIILR